MGGCLLRLFTSCPQVVFALLVPSCCNNFWNMLLTTCNNDACDVTLRVYPHRASLKNMPDHGGNQACPVWIYTLRATSQASYSPEYITPTQKKIMITRLH
jgi:hypothetical protein